MEILKTYLDALRNRSKGCAGALIYLRWALEREQDSDVIFFSFRCLAFVLSEASPAGTRVALRKPRNKALYFLNLDVPKSHLIKKIKHDDLEFGSFADYLANKVKNFPNQRIKDGCFIFILSVYHEIVSRLHENWRLVLVTEDGKTKPLSRDNNYLLGKDVSKQTSPPTGV